MTPPLMERHVVPGLSVAIIADARLVWRRGFGVQDSGSKQPVDNETVFEVGSVSKTVYAYAILKLCEKGVLDLDTPLTKYTPERFLEGDARLDLITARHVLSHTSGLPNWRSKDDPLRIQFTPGERFSYSGEGYSYLQSVVTHLIGHVNLNECATFEEGLKVCATDFDDYMKANLLTPLGMTSSGYVWIDALQKHMARPHDDKGKPFTRRGTGPTAARYGAAGNLQSTPTEYAKFLIEVVEPKPSDPFRLNRSSLDEMLRPQVQVDKTTSWGLGWKLQHDGDVITHGGNNPGFQALIAASRKHKSGFVFMTNGDNGFELFKTLVPSEAMQRLLPLTL